MPPERRAWRARPAILRAGEEGVRESYCHELHEGKGTN